MMIKNRMRGLATGFVLAASVVASSQAHAERFEGFGQDIPLSSAAKQIAPGGTNVEYGPGVSQDTSVTFSSAADWQSALAQAVAKKGLKATFGKDSVTISQAAPAPKAERPYSSAPSRDIVQKKHGGRNGKKHAAPVQSESGPRVVAEASAPSASPASSDAAAPARTNVSQVGGGGFVIRTSSAAPAAKTTSAAPAKGHGMDGKEFASKDGWKPAGNPSTSGKFIVVPGYDLRATLESWAASTGWTVNWKSEFKYEIEADATFEGDFVKATSALIQAMSEARPTITVDFFTANHVVVISNNLSDEVN